jgi:hypothetical protein
MEGIYNYIPETNLVSRVYSLQLLCIYNSTLFPMLNVLYFYISTFRSMCAVANMAAFCSSLISHFPIMLLRYFLNDLIMVLVANSITDITFVFIFHMHCVCTVMS